MSRRHSFSVSRIKPWLYDYLMERFADDPKVTVILDRRIGERPNTSHPVAVERRRTDRRSRGDPDDAELTIQGYLIVDL